MVTVVTLGIKTSAEVVAFVVAVIVMATIVSCEISALSSICPNNCSLLLKIVFIVSQIFTRSSTFLLEHTSTSFLLTVSGTVVQRRYVGS